MLKSTFILAIIFITTLLSAQKQIPIDSVTSYVGQVVKVCDNVAGTYVTKGVKPVTYLNLGADSPNTKLTIVIFQKDLINFPFIPSGHYKDMNICVTGEIGTYKEKVQIIANKPEQIEIN